MQANELANHLLDTLQRYYLVCTQRANIANQLAAIDSQHAELTKRIDAINIQIATISQMEETQKAEEPCKAEEVTKEVTIEQSEAAA